MPLTFVTLNHKFINSKCNLLVFGYSRSYFIAHNNKIFPELPICSILLFYAEYEYWNVVGHAIKKYTICNRFDTVSHSGNSADIWDSSSYGNIKIPSQNKYICEWHLILDNDWKDLYIGLTTHNSIDGYIYDKLQTGHKYSYCPANGTLRQSHWYQHGNQVTTNWAPYHRKINVSDIINLCIKLDLNKRQISFYVNGVYLGIAYENIVCGDDIVYNVAAYLPHNSQTAVTITKFCCYSPTLLDTVDAAIALL